MFNIEEQNIIKKIVSYKFDDLTTIGFFISTEILKDREINILVREDGICSIYCKKGLERESFLEIIRLINLFQKLIDERLIFLIPGNVNGVIHLGNQNISMSLSERSSIVFSDDSYIGNDFKWYNKNGTLRYNITVFEDKSIPFLHMVNSVPIIEKGLQKMVKNKFKAIEEKTLCWSIIAAIVCILSLCISLFSLFNMIKPME